MDHAVVPSGTRTQRLQNVDVRESDIRGGQEYIQRKEFYDELKVKLLFQLSLIQEHTAREANDLKQSLLATISKLPRHVQTMNLLDFCEQFGFELSNGDLVLKHYGGMDGTTTGNIFQTVQRNHRAPNVPVQTDSSEEVLSELQIVRGLNRSTHLRMNKKGNTYDLSTKGLAQLSESDKVIIQNEIALYMRMLNEYKPHSPVCLRKHFLPN